MNISYWTLLLIDQNQLAVFRASFLLINNQEMILQQFSSLKPQVQLIKEPSCDIYNEK